MIPNSSHGYISYAVFCLDRKSTRLNSSHGYISYAVFCLKKKSTRLNSSHGYISYAVFCLKKKIFLFEVLTVTLVSLHSIAAQTHALQTHEKRIRTVEQK